MSFKQRTVTWCALAVSVGYILFFSSDRAYLFAVTIATILGFWEWVRMMKINLAWQMMSMLLMGSILFYCAQMNVVFLFYLTPIFWLLMALLILTYPKSSKIIKYRWVLFLLSFPVFVPFWIAMVLLRLYPHYPIWALVFVLSATCAMDTFAYLIGKYWGRRPFFPKVSPSKTWEGFWGGFVCSTSLMMGLTYLPVFSSFRAPSMMLWIPVVVLAAVIGDLFESMIKRQCQVKDSGKLLPGHGGVFDRLDGLCASVPIFFLALYHTGLLHTVS